jgi:hypothetical protein
LGPVASAWSDNEDEDEDEDDEDEDALAATDDDNDVNVAWMITTYVLLGILIISAIVFIVYMARGNTSEDNPRHKRGSG